MAIVSVAYSRSALSIGLQPPGTALHSSHEPGELSQCFEHDDSTIKIILVFIVGNKRPPCLTCQLSCSHLSRCSSMNVNNLQGMSVTSFNIRREEFVTNLFT